MTELGSQRAILEGQAERALIEIYQVTDELERRRQRLVHKLVFFAPMLVVSGVLLAMTLHGRQDRRRPTPGLPSTRSWERPHPSIVETALIFTMLAAFRYLSRGDLANRKKSPVLLLGSRRLS